MGNGKSKGLLKIRDDEDNKQTKRLKYSGYILHQKGIVLEIDGLPTDQYKDVLFEFYITSDTGVFEVNAKFMGVEMDKEELIFQDLLQLRSEEVATIEKFGRAKFDVNLLINLLSRKFYGRDRKLLR